MKINEFYDQHIADHFDEDPYHLYQDCRNIALKQIQNHLDLNSKKLLDLCIGTGDLLLSLHAMFPAAKFSGFDTSAKMIERARAKFCDRGMKVNIFSEDVQKIENLIEPASVDFMAMHFLLSYVDPSHILRAVRNVLRAGGVLSLATSLVDEWFVKIQSIAKIPMASVWRSIPSVMRLPANMEALRKLLALNHFEIIDEESYKQRITFSHFEEAFDFAIRSSWMLSEFFANLSLPEIKEFCKTIMRPAVFPLEDSFTAGIVLARKLT